LLAAARRSESGYRIYTQDDLHTLAFIRRARNLGFSLEEVRRLLTLWQDRERASGEVKALAAEHIATLNQKINELTAMSETLEALIETCHGDDRPECPILLDLASCDACGQSQA
jgi:MerR family copper efflux transcriptional regulator